MYKASIVVPVYDVVPYLPQCVDSVLSQTCTSIELILVDDGSPDNSGAMCDEYAEKNPCISVIHKCNGGLGSARNVGVSLVQGKYIEFLDSDDWITPDTVEYLLQVAEEKNLDLVLFAAQSFVDGNPEDIHTIINSYNRSHNFNQVMDGLTCYRRMAECGEYFSPICMRFFSLHYFRKQEFWFQENIIHEDEDVGFLSVILAKRVEIVDKRFYQRRYRPGSIMTTKSTLKSLHGYASVYGKLAEVYGNIQPIGELKKVYINKMEEFLFIVIRRYQRATRTEKRKIQKKVQPLLKKGMKSKVPISKSLQIAEESLSIYEMFCLLRGKYQKIRRLLCGK